MITKEKESLLGICELTVLIVLIFVRCVVSGDNNAWICSLNHFGLLISIVAMYSEACTAFSRNRKFAMVSGIFILLIVVLCVIQALLFAQVIFFDAKINDIILLVTLLVTLPSKLYMRVIEILIK